MSCHALDFNGYSKLVALLQINSRFYASDLNLTGSKRLFSNIGLLAQVPRAGVLTSPTYHPPVPEDDRG